MQPTDIIALRHQLHANPGLSDEEQFAHDAVVAQLQQLHPSQIFDHVGGYGVVAVWGADKAAPTVAFRADTDALPIGHRCGHDGHTATLLRLAQMVDSDPTPARNGNIMLLWQPAEETGRGAQRVMASGVLQQYNIVAIYAIHNLPGYDLGQVVVAHGTFATASTGVVYHFGGRATHASTPELGLNPGLAVAQLAEYAATLGRPASSGQFCQSTLICLRVGEPAFGTSAGQGEAMFTLRAYDDQVLCQMLQKLGAKAEQLANREGLTLDTQQVEPFGATVNHEPAVNLIERVAGAAVAVAEPFRWSEDFGVYLRQYNGAMFGIGSGRDHPELHHPSYDFPDAIIEPTASLFHQIAAATLRQG
ncbi:MAG: M20/M25/M40 family metallo-hydrolase [Bacteroidales bacterium]|nr:M20/M25/M40 family metallo-hydrolase [Bacteroidales bacterium]